MSYPYRVKLSESCSEVVSDSDSLTQNINLENLLPEEEMKGIFQEQCEKKGFKKKGNLLTKKRKTGEVITIDLDNMQIKTTLEVKREVKVSSETTVRAKKDGDMMSNKEKKDFEKAEKEKFKEKIQKELKKKASLSQSKITGEIAKILLDNEDARREEMNSIVMETYKEAIVRKARQMGNIESMRELENGDETELMIRVTE